MDGVAEFIATMPLVADDPAMTILIIAAVLLGWFASRL